MSSKQFDSKTEERFYKACQNHKHFVSGAFTVELLPKVKNASSVEYTPDFIVHKKSKTFYVETKGYMRPVNRLKHNLFQRGINDNFKRQPQPIFVVLREVKKHFYPYNVARRLKNPLHFKCFVCGIAPYKCPVCQNAS